MIKTKSLLHFLLTLPTQQACIDYLEQCRWGENPISPYDPTSRVYKCTDNWYKCKNTGKRFNVKTGTILKHTKIPLVDWLWSLYHFLSKKGVSSCQLSRNIDVTQKSAWNLLKDIRENLNQFNFVKDKLKGTVEMDETLVGGKNKNRHWDKKVPHCQGRSHEDKSIIWGAIERDGYLVTEVVPNVERKTLEPITKKYVEKGSSVYTDELLSYKGLGRWYNHQIVIHRNNQYVKGEVTTNSIEGVWSPHFKVTINGTYHNNISDKYLQNYADEFTFRYNTRNYTERNRFDLTLSTILGKNLTYREFSSLI